MTTTAILWTAGHTCKWAAVVTVVSLERILELLLQVTKICTRRHSKSNLSQNCKSSHEWPSLTHKRLAISKVGRATRSAANTDLELESRSQVQSNDRWANKQAFCGPVSDIWHFTENCQEWPRKIKFLTQWCSQFDQKYTGQHLAARAYLLQVRNGYTRRW